MALQLLLHESLFVSHILGKGRQQKQTKAEKKTIKIQNYTVKRMRFTARNFGSNVSQVVWQTVFQLLDLSLITRSNTDTLLTILSVVYHSLPPCVILCILFNLHATGWTLQKTLFGERRCATWLATLFLWILNTRISAGSQCLRWFKYLQNECWPSLGCYSKSFLCTTAFKVY